MDQAPYHLDQTRRDAVLETIQEVRVHRGGGLLAADVRSNHVHPVEAHDGCGHHRTSRRRCSMSLPGRVSP